MPYVWDDTIKVAVGDVITVRDRDGRAARFRLVDIHESAAPTACMWVEPENFERAGDAWEVDPTTLDDGPTGAGDFWPPGAFLG
jgi:hypothetical protein